MNQIKICLSFLAVMAILVASSCTEKMTCDNPEGLQNLRSSMKEDIIEAWALKLSAEDYKGYKYGLWGTGMLDDYKTYLLQQLAEIKNGDGRYYEQAVQQYIDNDVNIEDIITDDYNVDINRCECSADISLTNSNSKNKVTYDLEKNSDGAVTGHYRYRPKAMLDDETNASDFIKENKGNLE